MQTTSSRRRTPPTGEIACGVTDLICTTKMDASFEGVSAHPGGSRDSGKNALLAACNAAINLYAITRHSRGGTRVNVGVLQAGECISVDMDPEMIALVRDAAGLVPAVTSVRDTVSMTGGGVGGDGEGS